MSINIQLLPIYKLQEVDNTQAICYVTSKDAYSKSRLGHVYKAKQVLVQSYSPTFPQEFTEEEDIMNPPDVEELVAFLLSVSELTLTICSTHKETAFSLLAIAYNLKHNLPPKYAIAAAAEHDLTAKPSIWILAMVDHYLGLNGELVINGDEYLEMGIAVTQKAKILEASWYLE